MPRVTTRREASEAVSDAGWRFLLGMLRTSIPVATMAEAVATAGRAVAACGPDADAHLRAELRPDRVILTLTSARSLGIALAHRITAAGLPTTPHGLDVVELAIDALDIEAVRPFWEAVLPGEEPPIWFQQMDSPRPQRNRIHLDICVPHDEAAARIEAALAAGGHLVSDAHAPAFWVLADPEGNEACVTTWQGRD
ncbi:VOC family protein [Actinoplanes sp. CA-142083]|uniref:VOC family protein n=1 Tax=Actinoplanes sp. CA-142083 TaxID=3239903 RepID=UPI003D943F91